ncbi:hypothetical protein [Desulforhopalus sp. 52FAK]
MKVNLKDIVENLLKWLIPLYILKMMCDGIAAYEMQQINGFSIEADLSAVKSKLVLLQAVEVLHNLVAGVWMFKQAGNAGLNKYIWGIFGLAKPFFGLLGFILLIMHRNFEIDRPASNDNIQSHANNQKAPQTCSISRQSKC